MLALSDGLELALYLMVATAVTASIIWFLAGLAKGTLKGVTKRHGGSE